MRLPWDLKPSEKTLAEYEATYGADHPEAVYLRRCIEACRRKYAKLPPIECIFIDHTAGLSPESLWGEEERDLLCALLFFWPDAPHLPEKHRRRGSVAVGARSLDGEKPEGRPHWRPVCRQLTRTAGAITRPSRCRPALPAAMLPRHD